MPDDHHATMDSLIDRLRATARQHRLELYIVGGVVRDRLLGRQRVTLNLDLAIPSKALEAGRALAQQLGGTYIALHEEAPTSRIVLPGEGHIELDLADFRGPTIEADLSRRDFTINAMAVRLEDWTPGREWERAILDPTKGRADLQAKRLRPCFPDTFTDDPLRILRAFRFAAELDFTLDPSTHLLLTAAAPLLRRVSGERVRDELMALLSTDRAAPNMRRMETLRVLDVVLPELVPGRDMDQGNYHHLTVLNHQLETLAQCERMFTDFTEFSPEFREPMRAYFSVDVVERRSRKALTKLAGLLHDVGKPATRRVKEDGEIWFIGHEHFGSELVSAVTERLRLSNREQEFIYLLVLSHLRPGHLSREPQLTPRAIYRFFRDLGDDGAACLLMWWADRLSTRGSGSRVDQIDQQRARLEELFRAYFFKPEEAVRPPKLVDGAQLMQALRLPEGPQVGALLRAIEEAQVEGRLHTPEDAIAFARHTLASPPGA